MEKVGWTDVRSRPRAACIEYTQEKYEWDIKTFIFLRFWHEIGVLHIQYGKYLFKHASDWFKVKDTYAFERTTVRMGDFILCARLYL